MRYQIHDPFIETTYRFATFDEATAKAADLGCGLIRQVQPTLASFRKTADGWQKEA